MATTTTYLGLTKPATNEAYDIGVHNTNSDLIDAELQSVDTNKQDLLVSGTNIKTVNSNSLLGAGNLSLREVRWRGAYSVETAYVIDDVVSYNGSSYICVLDSLGNLPSNTTYWSLFAQAGEVTTDAMNTALANKVDKIPKNKIYYKIIGDRWFEVCVWKHDNTYIRYEIKKDVLDDYAKVHNISLVTLTNIETYTSDTNYANLVGTWILSTVTNYYTATVGSSFNFTFSGTGFDYRHYADNRGGVFRFVIDGDTDNAIDISTFSATSVTVKETQVVRGLTDASHSVVATFIGDDPLNPPSGGVARGWLRYNDGNYPTRYTIKIYDNVLTKTSLIDFIYASSNIEFAYRIKPNGSAFDTYFVPEHGTATAFAISQELYIDDVLITDYTAGLYTQADDVRFIQSINGTHPDQPLEPLINVMTHHTIDNYGLRLVGRLEVLDESYCTTGYVDMLPISTSFGHILITNNGTKYPTVKVDGTSTLLELDGDVIEEVRAYNLGDYNDYVLKMKIQNPYVTLRSGETDRAKPVCWIQHRIDGTVQKLYPQIYENSVLSVGTIHNFGCQIDVEYN